MLSNSKEIIVAHLNVFYFTTPILVFAMLVCLVFFGFCAQSNFTNNQESEIINSNGPYLFVTAHPDDESMFFAPTLIQLLNHSPQEAVHLLCVTTGDYYKKGATRKKEIYKSGEILGIPASNVEVLNNSAFLDGCESWDLQILCSEIASHMRRVNPKYIFTFDDQGVSGHPNHISLSKALRLLLGKEKSIEEIPALLELKSVPLYRKYVSYLDIVPSFANSQTLFVSSMTGILQAMRAMYAHRSQFVWFRVLYILFSRYMMINDYTQVTL